MIHVGLIIINVYNEYDSGNIRVIRNATITETSIAANIITIARAGIDRTFSLVDPIATVLLNYLRVCRFFRSTNVIA